MRYMILIYMNLVLTACGIGGQWMNGDPSAGRNLKPYLQHFEKPDMIPEERRRDSEICGGGKNDAAQLGSVSIKAAQQSGETDRQTEARLHQEWYKCMKSKGYQYIR